jgi:hypothetical protein
MKPCSCGQFLLSGYPICGPGILVQPRAPRQEEEEEEEEEEEIKRLQTVHCSSAVTA